jgi:hypothetical protein
MHVSWPTGQPYKDLSLSCSSCFEATTSTFSLSFHLFLLPFLFKSNPLLHPHPPATRPSRTQPIPWGKEVIVGLENSKFKVKHIDLYETVASEQHLTHNVMITPLRFLSPVNQFKLLRLQVLTVASLSMNVCYVEPCSIVKLTDVSEVPSVLIIKAMSPEAVNTTETSFNFTRLHGASSLKTVIFDSDSVQTQNRLKWSRSLRFNPLKPELV